MAQIFDSNLNTHLNHEHPEYAYQGDLDNMVSDINVLRQHINEVDNILYNDITESSSQVYDIKSKVDGMLARLMNARVNFSNGIFDAGTFEQPGNDFIFDGGVF